MVTLFFSNSLDHTVLFPTKRFLSILVAGLCMALRVKHMARSMLAWVVIGWPSPSCSCQCLKYVRQNSLEHQSNWRVN